MASIRKRPTGKYRARYRDQAGTEHARHFDRKVDAQGWLDEVTTALVTGTYVDPQAGRATLREFYTTWSARQVWASGTRQAMDLAVRSTPFVDRPIRSLRRSDMEAWVKAMDAGTNGFRRPLAASTIHTRVQNVRSVLRAAVGDRTIARDPTEGLRLPRRRRAEAAMTIPTPEEVGLLVSAAGDGFKAFVGLCAFGGLRLGEAAAVQVSDIDFLRRTLTVSRQVQRAGRGEVEVTPPKYGSERTVFLPPGLLEMLSEFVRVHGPSRWVFAGDGDAPPHQNTVGHRWRSTVRKAGLSGIRLHDLRHYYASGLIASGCDVVTVQRALGHARATTTLNTYSHLWPNAEDRTRSAAQSMFTEAMESHLVKRPGGSIADSLRTAERPQAVDLRKLG